MNYWKILKIVGTLVVITIVAIVGINAGGSSVKPSVDSGTKFNF